MHYTDDDLLDRLYEAGRVDDHLERCAECRGRWEGLLLRRRHVLAPAPETEAWLLRIRLPLVEPHRPPALLRPLIALASLALLAVILTRPASPPAPVVAAADAQLLSEVYAMIQNDEPRAADAVHALFEVRQ